VHIAILCTLQSAGSGSRSGMFYIRGRPSTAIGCSCQKCNAMHKLQLVPVQLVGLVGHECAHRCNLACATVWHECSCSGNCSQVDGRESKRELYGHGGTKALEGLGPPWWTVTPLLQHLPIQSGHQHDGPMAGHRSVRRSGWPGDSALADSVGALVRHTAVRCNREAVSHTQRSASPAGVVVTPPAGV
jgi:hypothetical protein